MPPALERPREGDVEKSCRVQNETREKGTIAGEEWAPAEKGRSPTRPPLTPARSTLVVGFGSLRAAGTSCGMADGVFDHQFIHLISGRWATGSEGALGAVAVHEPRGRVSASPERAAHRNGGVQLQPCVFIGQECAFLTRASVARGLFLQQTSAFF